MKNMPDKIITHIKKYYKDIIINLVIILFMVFACFYNFPYYVYKPGGTIPLASRLYLDEKQVELGDYNLAYVSVAKGNLINLGLAKIIKNWDLVKEVNMVIPDTDYDTTFKIEQMEMQNSINIAKYIAYQKAGQEVEMQITKSVISGVDGSAQTNLQVFDEIMMVDDLQYQNDVKVLNEYINSLEVGTKIKISVKNDGKEYERYAHVIDIEGHKLIGIYLLNLIEVSAKPDLTIKAKNSEAGSSGGMMMSLAIYDALIPKDMTSGKKIVGTGTMELDGRIGSIGGVKYKLLGAQKSKADIFFIPQENYEEALKVYKDFKLDLELIPVATFDDVINYLDSI